MAKTYGHDRDTAARLRNVSRRRVRNPQPTTAVLLAKEPQSNFAYFRLMEDVTQPLGKVWARRTNLADDTLSEWRQVYNWDGILDGAVAGYRGLFLRVEGEWVIGPGACVPPPCDHDSTIAVGDPPDGIVGDPYTHSLTIEFIENLEATGLPPGLTLSGSGGITGTPTEAGTFYATVTADSDTTPVCTLTRIVAITIAEGA